MMKYRSLYLGLAFTTLLSANLSSSEPDPQKSFEPISDASCELDWVGQSGWTYFIQFSQDMNNWAFVPDMEHGENHSVYTFSPQIPDTDSPALGFFTRLVLVDKPVANKADAEAADFDGDGLPNLVEIQLDPQLNPLKRDTDGNGMNDGAEDGDRNGLGDLWEIAHFGSIRQDPSGDPDGDGLSNLEEFLIASSPNSAGFSGTYGSEYYEYDDLDRLKRVRGVNTYSFNYDPSGNLEEAK